MMREPQINPDGYASPVIEDRFQIMSSLVGGTFFVVDLSLKDDMVVRGDKEDILRFDSEKDAEFFILSYATNEKPATTSSSKRATERNKTMAKKVATALAIKELTAARKSAKAMDTQIGEKDMVPATAAKKIGALRAKVSAAPVKTAAPKVEAKVTAKTSAKVVPLKAKTNGTSLPNREDGEGSGAYIRRMLKAGYLDTPTLLAAVHAQFEGSKAGPSDISWNKNKLKGEGWVPPAA
jgi:hypothetical protein